MPPRARPRIVAALGAAALGAIAFGIPLTGACSAEESGPASTETWIYAPLVDVAGPDDVPTDAPAPDVVASPSDVGSDTAGTADVPPEGPDARDVTAGDAPPDASPDVPGSDLPEDSPGDAQEDAAQDASEDVPRPPDVVADAQTDTAQSGALPVAAEGACAALPSPCGWEDAGEGCGEGAEVCPAGEACSRGRCLRPATTDAPGCLEAAVVLAYHGAAPDRMYSFTLGISAIRGAGGAPIADAAGWWQCGGVPGACLPERWNPECYGQDVESTYDEEGLSATGAWAASFYRLRPADLPAAGTWAGEDPLDVAWRVRWPFSADDPNAFASDLTIHVWGTDGGCAVTTRYEARLLACPGYPYDPRTNPCQDGLPPLEPTTVRICPD